MADIDLQGGFMHPSHDELVDRIIRTVEVRSTAQDNLYTLSFRDADPNKSKRVVQSLVSIFIESGLGNKRQDSAAARRFIDEQVAMYEKRLEEAEVRLKDFRLRNVETQSMDGRGVVGQAADTGALLAQARLDLREAQNAREALRRQVFGADAAGGSTTPDIDRRIQAEQRNLDTLTQRYTEQHPDVVGARRILRDLSEEKGKEIAAQRLAATAHPGILVGVADAAGLEMKRLLANADASVAGLSARVDEFDRRLVRLKEALRRMPEIEKEYAQLNRDYEVTKKNYEGLVARRESAVISGEMEATAGVATFRLIDPPRVSPKPVYPNRVLLLAAALALSVAAGALAAWAAARLRPVFFEGQALRHATGLRVLGEVSAMPDVRGARHHTLRLGLFCLLAASMLCLYATGFGWLCVRSFPIE
jgi:polysaccharide chain length determinant protein (PEP-CTERM system associated)